MLKSLKGKVITAESVSVGHPDSYMDYVVNSCLDAVMEADPSARFACDGVAKDKKVVLAGEITTTNENLKELLESTVLEATKEVGYEWEPEVQLEIYQQSPDIALGTNDGMGEQLGASDQGTQSGYACNETDEYYPLVKAVADELVRELFFKFKHGEFKDAKADIKTQVTIDYTGDIPKAKTVVVAASHAEDFNEPEFKMFIQREAITILERFGVDASDVRFIINGTGKFTIYGPIGDSGEVGRKIVVDAYGLHPLATVGGGTYNGKYAGHVDRVAAYGCRYLAKNIVAAGLADECRIDVAYCIGISEPMSVRFDFNGTAHIDEETIIAKALELFSFTPYNLRKMFTMGDFATAGLMCHFGETNKLSLHNGVPVIIPWEQLDLVDELKKLV